MAVWIMTGKAQLGVRAVANQKHLRDLIDHLDMRVVAAVTFDGSVRESHFTERVGRFTLRCHRGDQIGRILQRRDQADGMRRA
jgi:hypothetical protein